MRVHSTPAVSTAQRNAASVTVVDIALWSELRRVRGVSERGRELRVARGFAPHGVNYTVTVLTNLANPAGFVMSNPRSATNTAVDFLAFLLQLVDEQHLVAGDVLVCDNASIHFADDIQLPLALLLQTAGVRLMFTPTYSPELNPCELIFAQLKGHLRTQRSQQHILLDVVQAAAAAAIKWQSILAYYDKCVYRFDE